MKKTSPGFAILEVIVAIVLLAGVLSAAVGLLVSAGRASDRNRDRVTATFLAQEGLELARNARDTAWKMHLPYDCAFGNLDSKKILTIERNLDAISPDCFDKSIGVELLDAPDDPDLLPAVRLPGKDVNTLVPSKFRRKLIVEKQQSNPEGVLVIAVVSFPIQGGGIEEITMGEILTDWRQK